MAAIFLRPYQGAGASGRRCNPSGSGERATIRCRRLTMAVRTRVVLVSLDGDLLDVLASIPDLAVVGFLDSDISAHDSQFRNLGADDEWFALKAKEPTLR